MQLRYFELSDFDSPDKIGSGENMKRKVLFALDDARHWVEINWNQRGKKKIVFKINSGYRTYAHNSTLKNHSYNSSHLRGLAVDIHAPTLLHKYLIIVSLARYGFQRFGISNNFVHADMDEDKSPSLWFYGGVVAAFKNMFDSLN